MHPEDDHSENKISLLMLAVEKKKIRFETEEQNSPVPSMETQQWSHRKKEIIATKISQELDFFFKKRTFTRLNTHLGNQGFPW